MPLIYVTGPSGARKSAVRNELIKRVYEAHDTDEDGMSAWWYDNQAQIGAMRLNLWPKLWTK